MARVTQLTRADNNVGVSTGKNTGDEQLPESSLKKLLLLTTYWFITLSVGFLTAVLLFKTLKSNSEDE